MVVKYSKGVKMINWRTIKQFVWIIPIVFLVSCSGQKPLTVLEVIQNAETLNGKTIRVRGQAYLWIEPSLAEMWNYGGCVPNSDASASSEENVVGWLTLYDKIDPNDLKNYGAPHDNIDIKISEDNFHCKGNYCGMTCLSFEVKSQQTYEFIGTLRLDGESELILENIDLGASRQLMNGEWIPTLPGEFSIVFP
jgi:hypothetical protein